MESSQKRYDGRIVYILLIREEKTTKKKVKKKKCKIEGGGMNKAERNYFEDQPKLLDVKK